MSVLDPVGWLRAQIEHRARAREYDVVMKCAALLGRDAGEEMYYLAHEDDPPPTPPDGSLWMRWEASDPSRDTALMFNAQMSYAIGRAEGFADAFKIDVFDKVHRSLREAA